MIRQVADGEKSAELRFLLLLLLFGFFDGFAEVRDGRHVRRLEDVLAHRAVADIACVHLGARRASHVWSGSVAGAVDDERIESNRGPDFCLLFGSRVLRHGLIR